MDSLGARRREEPDRKRDQAETDVAFPNCSRHIHIGPQSGVSVSVKMGNRLPAERFRRIFLLSPANTRGLRSEVLMRDTAESELAKRLRCGQATIGEVYAFISGLYFRGKAAYASAFAFAPTGLPAAVVIVPGIGLVPLDARIGIEQLRAISQVPIHEANDAYRGPLVRDAARLEEHAGPHCSYVLLGSIATEKYTRPLLDIFGGRLLFPEAFVGRGDMSRGGLMLRCARSSAELAYIPVDNAVRHGARPPKLEKWRKP